jgi:hypothetical protein
VFENEPTATLRFTENFGGVARPQTVCADGFTVSIQASSFHYCVPKKDNANYTHVELGFPSQRPEPWSEWSEYADNPDQPTESVYGYVPVAMVIALIDRHTTIPTPTIKDGSLSMRQITDATASIENSYPKQVPS